MARKKQTTDAFSEQLRNAVRACSTTRYALAKQLGISESTLSRFLSGERGLTLDLIDKLADVLGLQVVVTVQKTDRPTKRGAKLNQEQHMLKNQTNWQLLAELGACDANENHLSSRRGVWDLEDVKKLMCYNNNPYASYPDLRGEETTAFRAWLKSKGIGELAYATYPKEGEDAGYTYAMILDAGAEREDEVTEEMRRIIQKSWKRMESHA